MNYQNTPKLQFNLNPLNNWTNTIHLNTQLQFDTPAYLKIIATPACLVTIEGLLVNNYEIGPDGKEYQSNVFVSNEDMCYQFVNSTIKDLKVTAIPQPEYLNQNISLLLIFSSQIPTLFTP